MMKLQPCEGPFGVEVHDLDLRSINDRQVETCSEAQREHGVIFFRNQQLAPDEHIAMAERFGEIVVNRFFERVDDYPQIAMVRKEPKHDTVVGECWHTDHSYDQEPAMGSILVARQLPDAGGDTLFINMHWVFCSLSAGLRQTLRGLSAVHSSRHTFSAEATAGDERYHSPDRATQDSIHPMVITHPESGKEVLYVNPDFTTHIVGWNAEESAALLGYLYQVATRKEHVQRFQWQPGSIAFWDNRAVWHRAENDYPDQIRLMHRITLRGGPIH